jgi:hypothetical protein
MALAHKTVIGGLNIDRNGDASILLHLLIVDGVIEYNRDNHRIPVTKGENLTQKAAQIDAMLASLGRALLPAKDKTVIGQTLTACWNAMNAP